MNSKRATAFRIWATNVLKEYMIKGSAKQAMEKAETEYKKYKARTLSDVEKNYFDSIKYLESKF